MTSRLVGAVVTALALASCASGTVGELDAGDVINADAGDDVTPIDASVDAAIEAPIDAAVTIDAPALAGPGTACGSDSECASGHCENGFCCASGVCCSVDDNCNGFDVAPACDDSATCQGTRADGACSATFQCSGAAADDDSACAGLESNDCSLYPSVLCTADEDQPTDQAGLCATTCATDATCDFGSHCDAPSCIPDVGIGGVCDEPTDCTSGLSCVDGVCCTTGCPGTCRACDLAGSVGVCSNIPDGVDLDSECAGVGCTGFYSGWVGSTCYRKADISDAGATCGGDATCRTQAEECNAQTATTPSLTCGPGDMPDLATCTGSTAGVCVPIPCTTIEDFESGTWPAPGWTVQAAGGSVSGSYAHDGSFGVRDPGWHYRTSTTVLNSTGDILSVWIRGGTGRAYIGFDASAAGAHSFVLAPNTGDIRFQDNTGYGFIELSIAAFSFSAGSWYYVEIEHVGGTTVQGRVYASDGTTLLTSLNETFASRTPAGVVIRSFSGHDFDTIVHCD